MLADQSADCGRFEFLVRAETDKIRQPVEIQISGSDIRMVGLLDNVGLGLGLVPNLAHDLFHQVFERDQTGRLAVLEQQAIELARLGLPPAEQAAKIELQRKIVDAVTLGTGWNELPEKLRADVDTPYFRSWLLFDPAVVMRRLTQPVLIVHGDLDRQVPREHADRLELLSGARPKMAEAFTRKVVVAGASTRWSAMPGKLAARSTSGAALVTIPTRQPWRCAASPRATSRR